MERSVILVEIILWVSWNIVEPGLICEEIRVSSCASVEAIARVPDRFWLLKFFSDLFRLVVSVFSDSRNLPECRVVCSEASAA